MLTKTSIIKSSVNRLVTFNFLPVFYRVQIEVPTELLTVMNVHV